jgi:hypothetical protein
MYLVVGSPGEDKLSPLAQGREASTDRRPFSWHARAQRFISVALHVRGKEPTPSLGTAFLAHDQGLSPFNVDRHLRTAASASALHPTPALSCGIPLPLLYRALLDTRPVLLASHSLLPFRLAQDFHFAFPSASQHTPNRLRWDQFFILSISPEPESW